MARAEAENLSLCKSMRLKKSYTFIWNGTDLRMKEDKAKEIARQVALGVLNGKRLKGYTYFNECRLKKRYKTKTKLVKRGKLCFY